MRAVVTGGESSGPTKRKTEDEEGDGEEQGQPERSDATSTQGEPDVEDFMSRTLTSQRVSAAESKTKEHEAKASTEE